MRRINLLHHADEVRHLAFRRLIVDGPYKQHAGNWRETTRQRVGEYLNQYLLAALREYFNKDSYGNG